MYSFWITVIACSIGMLILVYTYQFEGYDKYWDDILLNESL